MAADANSPDPASPAKGGDEAQLRALILDLTGEYARRFHARKPFVAGESPVPVSGKVYDDNRLYSRDHALPASAIRDVEPEGIDWEFSRDFFDARKEVMLDPEWPKVMPPYDFFFLLKPLLLKRPERFVILSTRNVQSIHETLAFHGSDVVHVFGQEDIRRLGGKLAVAKDQHWLNNGKWLIVYVDDMNSHLEPFEGQIHLPLHADWGYGAGTPGSLRPTKSTRSSRPS